MGYSEAGINRLRCDSIASLFRARAVLCKPLPESGRAPRVPLGTVPPGPVRQGAAPHPGSPGERPGVLVLGAASQHLPGSTSRYSVKRSALLMEALVCFKDYICFLSFSKCFFIPPPPPQNIKVIFWSHNLENTEKCEDIHTISLKKLFF